MPSVSRRWAPGIVPGGTTACWSRGDRVTGVREVIEVIEVIEVTGTGLLYCPPYSPDVYPCMDGSCVARVLRAI